MEFGCRLGVTYLCTQLDICCYDGYFCNGNHEDHANDAQEAKNIIVAALVLPETLEDEEKFDEDNGEGNQASQKGSVGALGIPRLCWDLTGDHICLGRVIPWLCANEAIPAARIYERHLDEKPKSCQADKCGERNRCAGGLGPDEKIKYEYRTKKEAREEKGGLLLVSLVTCLLTLGVLTINVFFRQFCPPKVLYTLPEKYPEKRPAKMNKPMPTLINPPRKLGLRTPKQLRSRRPVAMKTSCMPDPTNGARSPG